MPERKTLNEDLFYRGSSANLPRLHTCENKVPFWDFSQFAVTPVYKVEFKGLTGPLKKISGILGLSFWELLTSGGISLTGFWIFAPRLLGLSRDWYIQSQRASLSLTPYMGITILLTQHIYYVNVTLVFGNAWIHYILPPVSSLTLYKISSLTDKYREYFLNRYIWLIDGNLTGATTPSKSGAGSNGNESVLHSPDIWEMKPDHLIRLTAIPRIFWGCCQFNLFSLTSQPSKINIKAIQ